MSFDVLRLTRDYGDIDGETLECRTGAALFDFSFMARARIWGPSALVAVQSLTPRRLDDLPVGRLRYCLRLCPDGHVAADLTIWRISADTFEVMSGRHQDVADLLTMAELGLATDWTDQCVIYAVQGPHSLEALSHCGDLTALAQLCYFGCIETHIASVPCLVGRLGYTGEVGFEIIAPREHAATLWEALAARARPAGFAAADILRIEAGLILFANELRLSATPSELGLNAFVGSAPADVVIGLTLSAFTAEAAERPILWQPPAELAPPARPGDIVITSACWSPLANATLGLGYILASVGNATRSLRDPTGRFQQIRRVARPYFDPKKLRPRASLCGV